MSEAYRILVTGSRRCTKRQATYVENVLYTAMARPLQLGRPVVVVQGKCPYGGVDKVAELLAEDSRGVSNEPHPMDEATYGKRDAGPARNTEMVEAGADICLAFPAPDSRGTWDCLRKAATAGIHVRIYPLVQS